ncbi:MAG: chemotaxis protein CheX [Spirochaetales bacterium]
MYTNHFLWAAEEFFKEIHLPLQSITDPVKFDYAYELTSSIGITGSVQGYLLIRSPLESAKNLVSGMANLLGVTYEEQDFGPFHRATLGEIANQIAGKALGKLEVLGFNCMLTPPTLFIGQNIGIAFPAPLTKLEKILTGDFGSIRLLVGLYQEKVIERM